MATRENDEIKDSALISEIRGNLYNHGERIPAKLTTDEKVLARVTDGIYRQPGSAIRELISNAYDADANKVIIDTDSPRFSYMTISDDGNGMSIETLVNMINHIGGSAKKTKRGSSLNVTDREDPTLSPNKKRKLIGKIGIGIFSVAQLTRHFKIITKELGSDFYIHAEITLVNFSESLMKEQELRGESFHTGNVNIWTEKTDKVHVHGTDIHLYDIKVSAANQLKSVEFWTQLDDLSSDEELTSKKRESLVPKYHIGYVRGLLGEEIFDHNEEPSLPWDNDSSPEQKFLSLYKNVILQTSATNSPKLHVTLDNYLSMLWQLSLSIPTSYIDQHPFSFTPRDLSERWFFLSNSRSKQAQILDVGTDLDKSFFELLEFDRSCESQEIDVIIDGIKLLRPIKLRDLPSGASVVKEPLVFFGKYKLPNQGLPLDDTGGDLSFDAYIIWCPKVIPKDHNGVMLRLHNASGIMFDETFMKYQIAEHAIKGQLTIEIFVNDGLDSALNIDRESFNTAHPHYQIICRWLHNALRQVISKYKDVKKNALNAQRGDKLRDINSAYERVVNDSYLSRGIDSSEKKTLYLHRDKELSDDVQSGFVLPKKRFDEISGLNKRRNSIQEDELKAKYEAILQILESYGLFDDMTLETQNSVMEDILRVMSEGLR